MAINTASTQSASGDYFASPTPSPNEKIVDAVGGQENLKLFVDILDRWDNEDLTAEQTDTKPLTDTGTPQPVQPEETSTPSSGDAPVYTVIPGDTLWQIAHDNNVSLDVLIDANPQFAANPDLIFPGQQVTIPSGQEIADGGELTDQAPTLTSNETANRSEATQVGYLQIPVAKADPLEEIMGLVTPDAQSIALAEQLSDHATQLNQIGGSGWS
jgi:spore coat assembly protein SafA